MKDATPRPIHRLEYSPPHFLVEEVELTFELLGEETRVRARSRVRRAAGAPADAPLLLVGQQLRLVSLALDGEPVAKGRYVEGEESLRVDDVPDDFTLDVENVIDPVHNKSLEGLYLSGGKYCTQCEPEGFRRITWFLDRPDVMCRYKTRIIADKEQCPVLLSNGNLVEEGTLDDGRHFAVWDDPFKKPSYLFALVAGDLVSRRSSFVTRSGREVELHVYVEAHDLDKTAHCMESLKKAMKWDEEVFGREYDLDVYMIVAVGDFNMGAMENKGLNIFNTKYVLARPDTATDADFSGIEGVVGHEYFHNWTGNRITCRDWFQLSLKEGLTVFRDQEFSAAMGSPAVKRIEDVRRLRATQFPEDRGPTSHPVRPDSYVEINNFYTHTVYEKGAEVVRMLHTLLGADDFRRGLDLYFERHDGEAVTCDDFAQALQDASGKDLTRFRRWYGQAGTPRLSVKTRYDEEAASFELVLSQKTPPTPGQQEKEPLHIPVRMALLDEGGADLPLFLEGETAGQGDAGKTTRVLELVEPTQTFRFTGIEQRPVPSLLRGFSAPVDLDGELPEGDLLFRMAHDQDAFNRWEASQELSTRLLLALADEATRAKAGSVPPSYLEAFGAALSRTDADPALLALALALPSEVELAEAQERIDVEGLHRARQHLRRAIAKTHGGLLQQRYDALVDDGPYRAEADAMGRRALRNLCLSYLAAAPADDGGAVSERHYQAATNMTDAMAALATLTHIEGAARERALADFYEKWKGEALVVDKWLMLQAISHREETLHEVQALLSHEAFSLENPNKVRALVGAFAMNNPLRFHAADGAGYRFLADRILELDGFNPQVAARLVVPLGRWRRFDEARQALMRAALERMLAMPELSRDVYEMASKSLRA